jgi:hypothetical protein
MSGDLIEIKELTYIHSESYYRTEISPKKKEELEFLISKVRRENPWLYMIIEVAKYYLIAWRLIILEMIILSILISIRQHNMLF